MRLLFLTAALLVAFLLFCVLPMIAKMDIIIHPASSDANFKAALVARLNDPR
jgi:hypothetical protein